MTSKEILQSDDDLQKWWLAIARDRRFKQLHLIVQTDIVKWTNIDEMHGAMKLLETLYEVAEPEPKQTPFPSPGLERPEVVHQFQRENK